MQDLSSVFHAVSDHFPLDVLCILATLNCTFNRISKNAIKHKNPHAIAKQLFTKLQQIDDQSHRFAVLNTMPTRLMYLLLPEICSNVLHCGSIVCYPSAFHIDVTIILFVQYAFADQEFRVVTDTAVSLPENISSMYYFLKTPEDVGKTVMQHIDLLVSQFAVKYQQMIECSIIDVQWSTQEFGVFIVDSSRFVKGVTQHVCLSSENWEEHCSILKERLVMVETIRDHQTLTQTLRDLLTCIEF